MPLKFRGFMVIESGVKRKRKKTKGKEGRAPPTCNCCNSEGRVTLSQTQEVEVRGNIKNVASLGAETFTVTFSKAELYE